MHQNSHTSTNKAPRDYYGPRTLLPGVKRRRDRRYSKNLYGPRGSEALPEGWNVLCPNRIREVRERLGYQDCMNFTREIGSINYQRLHRLERGRIIVRESEYELIAQFLKVDIDELKLPLLTQSETVEWSRRWGPAKQIEDGGDHDSVILSAYLRYQVDRTGKTLCRLCKEGVNGRPIPSSTMSRMWHAEKPIDRYPDTGMLFLMNLSGKSSWDEVILDSKRLYDARALFSYVDEVREPRVRYAPEDPDRRAPWTYVTNPNRTKQRRVPTQTPLSADPDKIVKRAKRETPRQQKLREASIRIDENINHVLQKGVAATLRDLFPNDAADLKILLEDPEKAMTVAIRARTIRLIENSCEHALLAERLGTSRERIRQIATADLHNAGLANYYKVKAASKSLKVFKA